MAPRELESEEEFGALKKAGGKLFVDFYAPWCQACKQLMPEFESLAEKHPDVTFVKVNVDELEEVAGSEGASGLPYFTLYNSGQLVARIDGKQALAGQLGAKVAELAGASEKKAVPVVADMECDKCEFKDPGSGNTLVVRIAEGGGALSYTVNGEARPNFKVLVSAPQGDMLKFADIDKGCGLPKGPGHAALLGQLLGLAKRAGATVKVFDPSAGKMLDGEFPKEVME
eukprot:TRINITY_DN10664_c0_g2_i1.p2 TRINITY_DN10664_c0_g2~~TRINITY_DN10664_c0_g2_i1.p2  ORF type:complete len:253 (+),score=103.58 TRINITY_DN10664_c0_g2_i1:77-760(+)